MNERLSAARELGQLGAAASDVAVLPLIAALKDPEARVRVAVAECLGRAVSDAAEARAAIRALVDAMVDGDRAVRIACVNALRAVATIHRAARNADATTSRYHRLGKMR